MYFTSRTLVFTNSHQFESTKSLYKFPLEASNSYLQWYSIGFNQLEVENLHKHSAVIIIIIIIIEVKVIFAAVVNKAQKKIWGFNGIRTHDHRGDTGAMLYRLSFII